MNKIKLYEIPRIGVFNVPKENAEYILGKGWENIERESVIIGESEILYIERIKCVINGYWKGKKRYKVIEQVEVGIHKSRLIKWKVSNCNLLL